MKKILSIAITLFILMSVSICASATDLSDGTYEVPVVLMHKEDNKESFGNKYVAQTALLEIENGKKTVTILLTTDMKGIEFSYYTNGSLEGNTAKGEPVSNVKVAGETYKQGFKIPVMTDDDIGLQFSVPVMPMSPSARLRIDYSKAVKLSAFATTVTPETGSVTQLSEATTEALISTETTVTPITSAESSADLQSGVSSEGTTHITEINQESETDDADSSVVTPISGSKITIILVSFVILIALIVIIVITKKKTKRAKNNDDK